MKTTGFVLTAATIALTTLATSSRCAAQTVSPKYVEPQTPIVFATNGEERSTPIQEFAVDGAPITTLERVEVQTSNANLLKKIELRIGKSIVGEASFDENGCATLAVDSSKISTNDESATDDRFELCVIPSDAAGPGDKLEIGVKSATFAGKAVAVDAPALEYRFAALVRDSGWDGVAHYRIPGIVRTLNGTIVAVYDARREHAGDLPANIDVACSRSFDGGKTWTPMRIALDFKGADESKEGVGDPSILLDPKTGRLWLAALWAHNGRSIRASEPGLKPETSGRLVIAASDDDGATWSEPRDITAEAAPGRDWRILFQGPGIGIATRDGALVFPAQFIDKDGKWFSTLVSSFDGGKSWKCGNGALEGTCEAQVVELNDGALELNMRNFSGRARSISTTRDFGETWTERETSKKALVEPICQASFIRFASTLDGDDRDVLAFANPASTTGRVDMTLKLSFDEGKTWTRALTLYRPGGWGYSSLVKIDSETIGILYETTGGLLFQAVKIEDVPPIPTN